jgi:hypothetical protein
MFVHFVGSLILIGFVLNIVLSLAAIPLALISVAIRRWDTPRSAFWSAVATQILLSLIYTGFVAVVAGAYADSPEVESWWIYAAMGLVVTYLGLGSGAHEKAKHLRRDSWDAPDPEMSGNVHGAGLGVVAGVIAYPLIYAWPQLVLIVPGAPGLFSWTIWGADWLMQFWVARVVLGLAVVSYLLNTGIMALIAGAMLVSASVSGMRSLLTRSRTLPASSEPVLRAAADTRDPAIAGGSRTSEPKTCSACGLLSSASAVKCDCGSILQRRDEREAVAASPRGIGGWLLLVALGLVAQPFRLVSTMAQTYAPLDADTWRQLTTPGMQAYHPMWGPLLTFEIAGNIVLVIGSVVLLFLFFAKKRIFPRAVVMFMVASLIFLAADELLGNMIPDITSDHKSITEIIRYALTAAIWIPYFLTSKRVKATFVRP